MAENRKNCPKPTRNKIFEAITSSPAMETIRRVNNGSQSFRVQPKPVYYVEDKDEDEVEVVHIEFDYEPTYVTNPGKTRAITWRDDMAEQPKAHRTEQINQPDKETGPKKSGVLHTEDYFTDYINRAKLKIRAMSGLGDGKSVSEISSMGVVKDHFADYVKRAKMKIRTTSNTTTTTTTTSDQSFK